MKKKSYAGEFFRLIQEEVGDCTDFILFHQQDSQGPKENFRFSHAKDDGFTAMMEVLRNKQLNLPQHLPRMGKVAKPGRWTLIWQFCLKSLKVYFKSQAFKNFDLKARNEVNEIPPSHASLTMTLEESQALDQYCLKNKFSPMAFLLFYLDQEVATLTTGKGNRLWMVPVTLRDSVDQKESDEDPLMTGFMDIQLPQENPKKLGSFIRGEFKRWQHWVGFYAFGLARFMPLALMRPMVRLQSRIQFRTGNFSYMGRWGDEKNPTSDVIGGYPPVTRNQPVAGIAIHWCGKLTLNFIAHPFLSRDPALALKVIQGWRERMLQAVLESGKS